MEEAGGKTESEIRSRLQRWKDLGAGHTVDNYEFHRAVREESGRYLGYLFQPGAPLQSTWKGLIRIYLAAQDKRASTVEDVRHTQIQDWGRLVSNNCMLELLPLPSPGTDQWYYDKWSGIPFLRNRKSYMAATTILRAAGLRKMILEHHPKVVVFYSTTYLEHWGRITRVDFTREPLIMLDRTAGGTKLCARFKKVGASLFVNCYHSTHRGVTNKYFDRIGSEILARTA